MFPPPMPPPMFPPILPPWFHGPHPCGPPWFCCHWLHGDGPPKFPPGPPNFPRPPGPPLCMGPPLIGAPLIGPPRPPRLSNLPRGPPRVFWKRPLFAPLSLKFFILCSCFLPYPLSLASLLYPSTSLLASSRS